MKTQSVWDHFFMSKIRRTTLVRVSFKMSTITKQ